MKKNLYKYLVLVIMISLTVATAIASFFVINKNENAFKMAILTDLHMFAEAQVGDPQSEDYKSFDDNGRFLLFSEALLKSATDNLIAGDSDVVIIPGDLTENGAKISHLAVASQLERLVNAGKEVYVIPGNHDINNSSETFENGYEEPTDNVTPEEFAEIYADYGYNNALERDTQTLSYTADLNDEYRLFSIDVSFYQINASNGDYTYCRSGRNTAYLDEHLMAWLENQLNQCKIDKKTPIGMMHYPLLSHLGSLVDDMGYENNKVNNNIALADLLIDGGMNFIFTGHLHAQNIAAYQNDNGKIYDVETGALATYPAPVRYFTSYNDEEIITSSVLIKVDEKHLPSYLSTQMRAVMLPAYQGFQNYY